MLEKHRNMKRQRILHNHPEVSKALHSLCGAASAFCFIEDPQLGWATLLGFHVYEAWEDFGYLHDSGFKDIWHFWVVFIPLAVVLCILKQTGVM